MKILQDHAPAHNLLAKEMASASMAPGSVTVTKTALMALTSIDEYVVSKRLNVPFAIQLNLILSNTGPHLRDSMLNPYNAREVNYTGGLNSQGFADSNRGVAFVQKDSPKRYFKYTGRFDDGVITGKGHYIVIGGDYDGQEYNGDFKNGVRDGYGVLKWPRSSRCSKH